MEGLCIHALCSLGSNRSPHQQRYDDEYVRPDLSPPWRSCVPRGVCVCVCVCNMFLRARAVHSKEARKKKKKKKEERRSRAHGRGMHDWQAQAGQRACREKVRGWKVSLARSRLPAVRRAMAGPGEREKSGQGQKSVAPGCRHASREMGLTSTYRRGMSVAPPPFWASVVNHHHLFSSSASLHGPLASLPASCRPPTSRSVGPTRHTPSAGARAHLFLPLNAHFLVAQNPQPPTPAHPPTTHPAASSAPASPASPVCSPAACVIVAPQRQPTRLRSLFCAALSRLDWGLPLPSDPFVETAREAGIPPLHSLSSCARHIARAHTLHSSSSSLAEAAEATHRHTSLSHPLRLSICAERNIEPAVQPSASLLLSHDRTPAHQPLIVVNIFASTHTHSLSLSLSLAPCTTSTWQPSIPLPHPHPPHLSIPYNPHPLRPCKQTTTASTHSPVASVPPSLPRPYPPTTCSAQLRLSVPLHLFLHRPSLRRSFSDTSPLLRRLAQTARACCGFLLLILGSHRHLFRASQTQPLSQPLPASCRPVRTRLPPPLSTPPATASPLEGRHHTDTSEQLLLLHGSTTFCPLPKQQSTTNNEH